MNGSESLKKRNVPNGHIGDETTKDTVSLLEAEPSETEKLLQHPTPEEDLKVESIDDAINAIGMGWFQWRLFIIVAVAAMFLTAEMLKLTVILPVIKDYWKLTSIQLAFFMSTANLGTGIGALGFGYVADRWGRHRVYVASFFVLAFFGLLQVISPDIYFFSFCRFGMGAAYGANQVEQWVLLAELIPTKVRGRIMMTVETFAGLGVVVTVLLAWWIEDDVGWRIVVLITGVPPLAMGFVFLYLLPTSPQYQASIGSVENARKILEQIAKDNKASAVIVTKISQLNLDTKHNRDAMGERSIKELFKPLLLRLTLLMSVIWVFGVAATRTLMWIPLYLKEHPELEGSNSSLLHIYETALLMATGDTLGPLIAMLIVNLIDRRHLLGFTLLFIAVFTLVMGFILNAVVLICLLPLATAAARVIVLTSSIYTPESYPTVVRSTAMGFFVAMQWTVIILMHWVVASILGNPFYVFTTIFAGQSIIAMFAAFWLPYDTRFSPPAFHFYEEFTKLREKQEKEKEKEKEKEGLDASKSPA